MADEEHLKMLHRGVAVWKEWREKHPEIECPDLSGANLLNADLSGANLKEADLSQAFLRKAILRGANLFGADLRQAVLHDVDLRETDLYGAKFDRADLSGAFLSKANLTAAILIEANLSGANFFQTDLHNAFLTMADLEGAILMQADLALADLRQANLRRADLRRTSLYGADLAGADLRKANLSAANLREANLREADLRGANLEGAQFIGTDLCGADLTGSSVYGASIWAIKVNDDTKQQNLVITPVSEAAITVDNIKVAQFIYLLLNNREIREVIDTITSKSVLILGRFTPPERKEVLDALQTALRKRGFVPITFDFDRPTDRDFTETIMTLAGMSAFVIADITNPKSSPLELQAAVPNYMIPFVPIIQQDEKPFSMFRDLHHKYEQWVLPPLEYHSSATLVARLKNAIILPALDKRRQLALKKAQELPTRNVSDYPEDDEP